MRERMVVVLAALVVAGCSSLGLDKDDPLETGRVLFDSYRLNTDWGYELEGIYVDSDGLVWHYERSEPWYPAEQKASVVLEQDLLQKYGDAKRVGSVDPRVLEQMVALIPGAARGRVARETPSFERSGSLDVAYVFIRRTGNYDTVFLNGSGAWAARNFSREAQTLLEWLGQVKKTVGYQ
jgi:hypothetical protein